MTVGEAMLVVLGGKEGATVIIFTHWENHPIDMQLSYQLPIRKTIYRVCYQEDYARPCSCQDCYKSFLFPSWLPVTALREECSCGFVQVKCLQFASVFYLVYVC